MAAITRTEESTKRAAGPTVAPATVPCVGNSELTDILVEQFRYLLQYADQERDRYERVKAVLLESFN